MRSQFNEWYNSKTPLLNSIRPETRIRSKVLDRLEKIILDYENAPGSTLISDEEKRDALFNAIINQLHGIQFVEFMTNNQIGNGLYFDDLKLFIIQAEANRAQATTKNHPSSKLLAQASVQFIN